MSLDYLLRFRTILCAACLLLGVDRLSAAHIIGGEVTYECLGWANGDPSSGQRTYQFYMNIYRDCQGGGANFDSSPGGSFPATVTIFRESQVSPVTVLSLAAPARNFVDPALGNPCVIVPPNVCVQQGVYTFPPINLPVLDESYYISYQRCCRNNTISNIIAPEASGATYFMELTAAAQSVCNNSPTFNFFPPPVVCANEPLRFDHSATDADGDQLVYELCAPFLGGGLNFNNPTATNGLAPDPESRPPYDPVNFLPPLYSPLQPLGPEAGLSIDINTGLITGMPNAIGQFVVGVCVSEFRNGELLSVVRRDFQFNVTNCPVTVEVNLPETNALGADLYVTQCADREVFILNESIDQAFIEDYRWEFDLGGGRDTVISTWNAALNFPEYGTFEGRLILNPNQECSDTANLVIELFPDVEADFSAAYDTCVAGPVQFSEAVVSQVPIANYAWSFGAGAGSPDPNPQHKYATPGTKQVSLRVIDANGCRDSVQQTVSYFPAPAVILVAPSQAVACPPAAIVFDNLSEPVNANYVTEWDFGDGNLSAELSPTHIYGEAGTYDVSVQITSPIGCMTDTVFEQLILIEPGPVADFAYSPESPDNFNAEVSFTDFSERAERWSWQFEGRFLSAQQNPMHAFRDTGLQEVRLVITHPLGCRDTAVQFVDVQPKATFFLPNAFSPNDDGINEVYKGKGFLRGVTGFQLSIWNRWGEVVFETEDPEEGWNGRFSNAGKPAPQGVYYARVNYRSPRGEPVELKGVVTLIR